MYLGIYFTLYRVCFQRAGARNVPSMLYMVVSDRIDQETVSLHYDYFSPYHPFLLISFTLITVALKLSLNIFLHLSLFNLFLFMPGLS